MIYDFLFDRPVLLPTLQSTSHRHGYLPSLPALPSARTVLTVNELVPQQSHRAPSTGGSSSTSRSRFSVYSCGCFCFLLAPFQANLLVQLLRKHTAPQRPDSVDLTPLFRPGAHFMTSLQGWFSIKLEMTGKFINNYIVVTRVHTTL